MKLLGCHERIRTPWVLYRIRREIVLLRARGGEEVKEKAGESLCDPVNASVWRQVGSAVDRELGLLISFGPPSPYASKVFGE